MISNPFSTRCIRPGALPFLFRSEESAEQLVERLQAANWRGQIIGAHGSGKSTLLATLEPMLVASGRELIWCSLHDGQRIVPEELKAAALTANTQVVIDGYEQLGWWSRWRLKRRCLRHGSGLLATAHRDVGLPMIYRTRVDVDLACEVIQQLWPKGREQVDRRQIATQLAAYRGNLRELLFSLYDFVERQGHTNPKR